ncbi:N-acetylmuramoyl-L-alanine amidase family protein [Xiamenia xianingshaonis]|uniref:N-acetylmuramoyl-L-alanine amidase family protein n=1 Tax=Xiamenia xianingshaonis TaxID=2682776 RepID=UPI001409B144|nr:N-acetylmuramoyl-L-alanine amidase family protein [Xiamenia xianingshaonis]
MTEYVMIPAGWKVTLDLNNYAITSLDNARYAFRIDDHVTATVKNGSLNGGTNGTVCMYGSTTEADNYGMNLTLENVDVVSSEGAGGIYDFGVKSVLTLEGGTVEGDWWAIYHNGSTAGFKLKATSSTIKASDFSVGDAVYSTPAIYIAGSKENTAQGEDGKNEVELKNCDVTGPTGIESKYTNMHLTDCNVKATSEEVVYRQNDNGYTGLGFAVVSTDNSVTPKNSGAKVPPKPEATIEINGGTYTGLVGLSQFEKISDYKGFEEATYEIIGGAFTKDPKEYGYAKFEYIQRGEGNLYRCAHSGTGKTVVGYDPATCGDKGYSGTTYCDFCDEVVSGGYTIPATGEHTYGEWTVTKEATETEAGSQERACSVCGEKETQEIPACGHTPSAAWKSDATDHWKVCEGCGAELEKAAHDFGEWKVTKEATETEPGEKARSCSVCGAKEAEELPALGHKPSEAWQSDAGSHWKVCEGCGAELEKAAHSFGDWTVTKEATEAEPGFRERSCSACGYVQAEETEKLSPAASVPEGGSGWVESNDGTWGYVDAGEPVEEGWKEVGGEWYYFEEETMQTGWKEVDGDWYYLNGSGEGTEGSMATGWKQDGEDWYYLEGSGKMATGWAEVGGEWYHLGESGRMDTGWKEVGGTWYYLNRANEGTEGAMAIGWKKVGGEWYYLAGSGAMRSGWQKLGGVWYLLNATHDGTFGRMLEGWQRVDARTGVPTSANSWYYLNPGSGAMAANRWVGGYYVDASGLWVR